MKTKVKKGGYDSVNEILFYLGIFKQLIALLGVPCHWWIFGFQLSFEISVFFISSLVMLKLLSLITQVKHGRDSFLLLITDGVHFSMSDGEICDTIQKCHTPHQAATTLTDQAIQYGSDDNASAIIVPLGQWGKDSSTTLIPALRWQGRGG